MHNYLEMKNGWRAGWQWKMEGKSLNYLDCIENSWFINVGKEHSDQFKNKIFRRGPTERSGVGRVRQARKIDGVIYCAPFGVQ